LPHYKPLSEAKAATAGGYGSCFLFEHSVVPAAEKLAHGHDREKHATQDHQENYE
jgi:hypothetical protein